MEPTPALDTSRPSPLRLAGFLVTVTGALLAGIGATATWVTVGIEGAEVLDSASKGTDLWDGRVVLLCALVMLVGILVSRMAASAGIRRTAAVSVLVAGILAFGVAGAFVLTADSRFSPVDDVKIVAAISEVTGATPEEIRAEFERVTERIGAFTEVGPGPYIAILGGLAGFVGGILALAWVSRVEPSLGAAPGSEET